MFQSTNPCRRTLSKTKSLLNQNSSTVNKSISSNLTIVPIHLALPVVSLFWLAGIHSSVVIYSLIFFHAMHVLVLLGICEILKDCFDSMLGDNNTNVVIKRTKLSSCRHLSITRAFHASLFKRIYNKSFHCPSWA